jgi:uncharacterized protein (DUF2235 family)
MKRLILCCDGTWNRADQEKNHNPCPTNVVSIAVRIAKRDGNVPQVIYYDQGVGTGNIADRLTGGAFGDGLEDNIYDAYRFLIANYEPQDELFLFGFSRGAFTVRSLGGMIRKCGILKRDAVASYRDAVQLYHQVHSSPDDKEPREFRERHSVCGTADIPIKFLGVWDTVGALGIPIGWLRWLTRKKYQFHDTELSRCVQFAYHALAIDEHRQPFAPTLWLHKPKPGQKVEQVWFCGAHSDVGGGYAESKLSDIALEWMMEKAKTAGLVLDNAACSAYPLHSDPLAPLHNSRSGFQSLLPSINRKIGLGTTPDDPPESVPAAEDPTQSVHTSVMERWDQDPAYRPESLREYFDRRPDKRVRQPECRLESMSLS